MQVSIAKCGAKLVKIDDIEKITGIDFLVSIRNADNGVIKEGNIDVIFYGESP